MRAVILNDEQFNFVQASVNFRLTDLLRDRDAIVQTREIARLDGLAEVARGTVSRMRVALSNEHLVTIREYVGYALDAIQSRLKGELDADRIIGLAMEEATARFIADAIKVMI